MTSRVGLTNTFPNSSVVPPGTKWEWDYGDGGTSSDPIGSHVYTEAGTYKVKLSATVPNIPKPFPSNELSILIEEFRKITTPKGKIYIGQEFPFTNPNKQQPGDKYVWTFGDGETSELHSPKHHYKTPGDKTITLTTTIGGVKNVDQVTLTVYPIIAKASSAATTAREDEDIQFRNNTEGPPGMTWKWDFGDNTPKSSEKEPSHTYTEAGEYEITLTAKAPNVEPKTSKPLKVKVTPVFVTPDILTISITPKEIGADGNYTAKIIVEVTGTYKELKLKIKGNLGTIQSPSPQTMKDVKGGKHTFEIIVPEPPTSVTRAPLEGKLEITATIFPDDPNDEKKATGYAKTETLPITLIPQKPAWLLYAYILAGLIILGIIVTLVVMAKRPVVPGTVTVSGDETYLSSPSVGGAKKGKKTIQLGELSSAAPEYDDYWMVITATRRDRTNRLRISASLNTKLESEGELVVNGEYHDFNKPVACSNVMTFEWTDENGQKMEVIYDPQQSEDDFGYDDHSEDDDFENF